MTITLYNISHLYDVDDSVVFYKRELYKESNQLHQGILDGTHIAHDIFGRPMDATEAAEQLLIMVDSPSELTATEAIYHNMELGKQILALWREYVMIRNAELGISGIGIAQLQNFYLVICALLSGMLAEAALMIEAAPTDEIITDYIKQRFATACRVADRIP